MKKIPHDLNEVLAVVNDNNEVIGSARRKEIHQKGLQHREVYVYLINDKNEVLLHKRKDSKLIDHSCSGHFPLKQEYKEAAQREFLEELGVSLNLGDFKEIGAEKLRSEWFGKVNSRFAKIFLVKKNIDKFTIDKGEIEGIKYYNKEEIIDLLKKPHKLTPSAFKILSKYILPLIEKSYGEGSHKT